jgi:three-Cys-motif partner protein
MHDEVGRWTEIKLEIIRDYAEAYSRILSARKEIRRHIYIDAFAGSGRHISRTTGEIIAGSPQIAIDVAPPFSEYHFIDLNHEKTAELRRLARARSNVFVYDGDCNDVLLENVFPRCRYEDYSRALCLLDPYGLNINWDVPKVAGSLGTVDMFYNFMIMDANMNVLWKNPAAVPDDQVERMTSVWGDESWRSVAYRQEPGLFGPIDMKRENEAIAEAFRQRLRKVAGFKHVLRPLPMRNSKAAVIYYLFFASPKDVASRIVKDIFDKYKRLGV